MQVDLSRTILDGFASVFTHLGGPGKVVLGLIAVVVVFPWILRILSFFRRGGGQGV